MLTIRSGTTLNPKAWFPYGGKHVVTVVEIDSFSISMIFTTLLRHIHDHMETRLKGCKINNAPGAWANRKKWVTFLRGGGGGGYQNVHMTFLVDKIDL